MLHSMGYKEAIINNPATLPMSTPATGKLEIKGFGTFDKDKIVSATGQRFISEKFATLTFDTPTPTSMGLVSGDVNKSVRVLIRVNTSRHSSEYATDFILRGRPLVLELVLNYADTQAQIAAKLILAFAAYETKFNLSSGLPFNYHVGLGNVISLQAKEGHLSFQNTVSFLLAHQTYGSIVTAATALEITAVVQAVGSGLDDLTNGTTYTGVVAKDYVVTITSEDTPDVFKWSDDGGATYTEGVDIGATNTLSDGLIITFAATTGHTDTDSWTFTAFPAPQAGAEPIVDGKYLEENVRMSMPATDGAYGIRPDERPIISASYTTIKWRMKTTGGAGIAETWGPHANAGLGVGNIATDAYMDFIIYLDEASNMATGGAVDDLMAWLITGAPVATTFYLSDGTTGATDVSKFLADSNA